MMRESYLLDVLLRLLELELLPEDPDEEEELPEESSEELPLLEDVVLHVRKEKVNRRIESHTCYRSHWNCLSYCCISS
jgi:hypothetical protein